MAMAGGFSGVKPVDAEVTEFVSSIQPQLLDRLHSKHASLEVVEYKTQVVAGLNYLIKLKLGDSDEYAHVKVWRKLGAAEQPEILAVETGKTLQDKL